MALGKKKEKAVKEEKPKKDPKTEKAPEPKKATDESNLKVIAAQFVKECEANAPRCAPELRKTLKGLLC